MPKVDAIAGERCALTACDQCGEAIGEAGIVTLHATGSHKVVWRARCGNCSDAARLPEGVT